MGADPDRVPMAKAALDILGAFRGVEVGQIDAPEQPAPIPFTKLLGLLFTEQGYSQSRRSQRRILSFSRENQPVRSS